MRARADLVVSRQVYQGRGYYVIKDPLSLEYYRFQEEEFFLLQAIDGETSLDTLQQAFENRFPPQRIDHRELARLVSMLHRSGLVVSDAPGQGEALERRRADKRQQKRMATWTNPLGLRFKGINPDQFLGWLNGWVGPIFSRGFALCVLLLALCALLLVTIQFDVFRARLPWFHEFFAVKNWLSIAGVLAVTKVLHEFGHGLACKRLGGECHEMGVMFLVLTPCLYCNVSDSWMLPNKWHRAAIGAAGMYVEILLASLATFLWWFSHPGPLHYMSLNVMFVCSVSTILFNANPLLRFDGYYILSDIVEIPNLRQKASTILQRKLGSWLLGLPANDDPFLPKRHQIIFAIYTMAASVYRWMVSAGILWFLYHVFEPYGLQFVGQIIALMAMYGLFVQPVWKLAKFFYVPGRLDQVDNKRTIVSASAAALLLLAFLFLPLPYYVYGTLRVEPRGASAVYVDVPGVLTSIDSSPHTRVAAGQPMITLSNVDLDIAIEQLTQERNQVAARVDMLRHLALTDDAAAAEIDAAEESLLTLQQQLTRRQDDKERLQIAAPLAGHLFPPTPVLPPQEEGRLATWSGTPLQLHNVGAYLPAGTPIGQVGDPTQMEAVIFIDQGAIEFIEKEQGVEIQLVQQPGQTYRCKITSISAERQQSPSANSGHRTEKDSAANATYQASAPFVVPEGDLIVGGSGTAKIHAGYRTLASRLWWAVRRTFRLEG